MPLTLTTLLNGTFLLAMGIALSPILLPASAIGLIQRRKDLRRERKAQAELKVKALQAEYNYFLHGCNIINYLRTNKLITSIVCYYGEDNDKEVVVLERSDVYSSLQFLLGCHTENQLMENAVNLWDDVAIFGRDHRYITPQKPTWPGYYVPYSEC